ncbi:TIGR04279 domain-containing protein [Methanosarcina sp.]|uniref:TIGR04279 domain-containing protein n=1 Tax=Methanosarcina sp. TaxID=2213 RepID=UPI002B838F5B|nr:TIGR04279 domain-containing protein [Methanosarcina sp.]HOW15841.1 TIGR04279 domain-containing protein [Methanosarcina sp.]
MAGSEKTDAKSIGNLNFTDKVVYFLDHTNDPAEGNWITMGFQNEEKGVKLPEPIKLTYNGPKHKDYGGASGTLNKEENESYTIKYPSTSSYTILPVFLPDENVTMSFHGDSYLKGQNVEIYLFKLTQNCAQKLLDSLLAGDIGNLNTLFKDSVGEKYEKHFITLDNYGDISDYDLGCLDAGNYCIVMVQKNEDESLTVLSSTVFIVTEYELCISSSSSIVKGNNLNITMSLEGAPYNNYSYGAVLIREQAYKANIEINSNGTKNGTSIIVNDIDLVDEFDINSSNYRSKLTKKELQTEIQTFIGEGKGTISIGESGQNKLSLTAFDLPVGSYYLFVGAYSPGKGLVGLSQKDIEIRSKASSKKDNDEEESSESEENIKRKDSCKKFVSKDKRIKFEFNNSATPINYIIFTSKNTAGNIKATVEELKGKSSLTSIEPEGVVYKYINIWVGNSDFANSKNIKDAIVGFKVGKEWIDESHINIDTITLQHYSKDQWNSLETEKINEDDKYVYFEAETSSFSPFAITASKNILENEEKTVNEDLYTSEFGQQDNSELVMESKMPSKENRSLWSKAASIFIGFLAIILIGVFLRRKADLKK